MCSTNLDVDAIDSAESPLTASKTDRLGSHRRSLQEAIRRRTDGRRQKRD